MSDCWNKFHFSAQQTFRIKYCLWHSYRL